jgi:hypothetical protein
MKMSARRVRRGLLIIASAAAAIFGAAPLHVAAAAYSGTAQNGFSGPTGLTGSDGLGEPTIVHDSANRLFVTAPQAIGNVNTAGGSPMFTSSDGGNTWSSPVRDPYCTAFSGGDTDLAVDNTDDVYQTDLYLVNSCVGVSTDHGGSFAAGDVFGTQTIPGDDRPWVAFNSSTNQLYYTFDSLRSIDVTNTVSTSNALARVQSITETTVIPECLLSLCGMAIPGPVPVGVRACVCPPGGIAADNSVGGTHSHTGRVYVSFSHQQGTAIAHGDPVGTCPACGVLTWVMPPTVIADASSGSAFQDEWNFDPIKVDANGTVYVMWAHAPTYTNRVANTVKIEYAYSTDGGATFSTPVTVSTEPGTTTFPTMDVVSPGVLDVAWYGDPQHTTDPNLAKGPWNVYYARITGADTNSPSITSPQIGGGSTSGPEIAVSGMHNNACIQTGGNGSAQCSDRSLLDFFQLTDDTCGNPNIIYTGGDAGQGVGTLLYFTKLALNPCTVTGNPPVPEAPWVPLLMAPAAGIGVLLLRRKHGQSLSRKGHIR